jgi:hypothetical protein
MTVKDLPIPKLQALRNLLHDRKRRLESIRGSIQHLKERLRLGNARNDSVAEIERQLSALKLEEALIQEAFTESIKLLNSCEKWLEARGIAVPADMGGYRTHVNYV